MDCGVGVFLVAKACPHFSSCVPTELPGTISILNSWPVEEPNAGSASGQEEQRQ